MDSYWIQQEFQGRVNINIPETLNKIKKKGILPNISGN